MTAKILMTIIAMILLYVGWNSAQEGEPWVGLFCLLIGCLVFAGAWFDSSGGPVAPA